MGIFAEDIKYMVRVRGAKFQQFTFVFDKHLSSRSRKYSQDSPLLSKYFREILAYLGICLATFVCSKMSIWSNNSLTIELSAILMQFSQCLCFPTKTRGISFTQQLYCMYSQSVSNIWLVGNRKVTLSLLKLLLVMQCFI